MTLTPSIFSFSGPKETRCCSESRNFISAAATPPPQFCPSTHYIGTVCRYSSCFWKADPYCDWLGPAGVCLPGLGRSVLFFNPNILALQITLTATSLPQYCRLNEPTPNSTSQLTHIHTYTLTYTYTSTPIIYTRNKLSTWPAAKMT